jgi:VanZ family protein
VLKYTWPVFVWAFLILALCAMPGKDIPHVTWLEAISFDKWVHAGVFFVLVILGLRGLLHLRPARSRQNANLLTLLPALCYGGLLEVLQGAVFVDRSADVFDFIANSFGCVMGVVLFWPIARRFPFLQLLQR